MQPKYSILFKGVLGLCFSALSLVCLAQTKFDIPLDTTKSNQDKIGFNVSVGTSFSSNFKNMSNMSYFVAPQLQYQLSDKWKLKSGILAGRTTYFGNFNTPENTIGNYNPSAYSILGFVSGSYAVNKKLTISGTAFYGKEFFDNSTYNTKVFNFETKGISVDMRYKVSEHSEIGIGFSIREGYNPYQYQNDPLYNHRISPSRITSFSPAFGSFGGWGY